MTGLQFKDFRIARERYTIEVEDFQTDLHEAVELQAPSGFGKTSVVRAVLGLEAHAGDLHVQGIHFNLVPVHKRRTGVVFQDQVLFTHQNAVENAMSGLLLQGVGGGPGQATQLPATFMYSYTFTRNLMGIGASSAIIMLVMIFSIIVPYLYTELRGAKR